MYAFNRFFVVTVTLLRKVKGCKDVWSTVTPVKQLTK